MDPGFYRFWRSITPSGFLKWIDRYNYEAQELQDLIQTAPAPIQVQTLDCTVAQSISLLMNYPARAFVIYFYDSTSTTKTVKANGFVKVRINDDRVENEFPAKHNRGYRGDFYRLYLTWPAQANTKADLVMHMFDDDPWEMDAVVPGAQGTVTSVAFAEGSTTPIFTITGSPIVGAGTITETLKTQAANVVFAGPTTGAAAQPTFRALVNADLSAVNVPVQETPAGLVNTLNVTYTLANTPISAQSVVFYLNGLLQRQPTEYSMAGAVATFVSAPVTGQTIYATYEK